MAKIDLTYDLVNYTPANASPVESNFDRIEQHVNQELIERDGTVQMRAQLMLVGDPLNALDAAPKQYVDQVLPIGIIMMHGGTAAPPGGRWAICNGAEILTANNPELYNVIGHNFSPAGTPGSRYHLPNLRDRVPMGAGTKTTIGEAAGSRDSFVIEHAHTLSSHHHSMTHDHGVTSSAGSHNHVSSFNQASNAPTGGTTLKLQSAGTDASVTTDTQAAHYHDVPSFSGVTGPPSDINVTSTQGTTGVDRNLPPFQGVQFIIRIK